MSQDNTSLIRSILNSEVKFVIGIAVFVFGGVAPYFAIKEDIALIQKDIQTINLNHESHIQDIMTRLEKLEESRDIQQQTLIKLINN